MRVLFKFHYKLFITMIIMLLISIISIIGVINIKEEEGTIFYFFDFLSFLFGLICLSYMIVYKQYKIDRLFLLTKVNRKQLSIYIIILSLLPVIFGGILSLVGLILTTAKIAINLISFAIIYSGVISIFMLSIKYNVKIIKNIIIWFLPFTYMMTILIFECNMDVLTIKYTLVIMSFILIIIYIIKTLHYSKERYE